MIAIAAVVATRAHSSTLGATYISSTTTADSLLAAHPNNRIAPFTFPVPVLATTTTTATMDNWDLLLPQLLFQNYC